MKKINCHRFWTHFGWACAAQHPKPRPNGHQVGRQKPRLAMRLGNFEGWKPPEVEVGSGTKCPVCLAQDTASFQIQSAGRKLAPNGPELGQQTPFRGENRSKHNKKAAHTLCEWILSLNEVTGPRRHRSRRRPTPFLLLLCRLWPALGPSQSGPYSSHLGPRRGRVGEKTHPGAKEDPHDDSLGPKDPSKGLRNPNGGIRPFFQNFGAGCRC